MTAAVRDVRVLIADDHTLLREAMAELLGDEAGIEIVGLAGDVTGTVRSAARCRPDVVLLDVEMPGNEDPAATVRSLAAACPGVRILVLTMHDDTTLVRDLLAAGVAGYLHKSVSSRALTAAVHNACTPGHPTTVSLSAPDLFGPTPGRPGLSPREMEVITLAAQGLSNYRIARRLDIVEGTVKRHMRSIFDKLDARSRVEAANTAVAHGLIPAPRRHSPMAIPPPTGRTAPVT